MGATVPVASLADLLPRLREAGVCLRLRDNRLRVEGALAALAPEVARHRVALVAMLAEQPGQRWPSAAAEIADHGRAILTCLADVTPRPVTWLWHERLAVGKLSLLSGSPGLGKSVATCRLIAALTRGQAVREGDVPCVRGGVVMLTAEDDVADTVRPRLDAAAADVTRVTVLEAIRTEQGGRRVFSLAQDLPALEEALDRLGAEVRLVVIDPVTAYLGGRCDGQKDAEVRGLLAPLSELANRRRLAVLTVGHLRKAPDAHALNQLSGSVAWGAAARSVFLVVQDPEDRDRRLLVCAKSNLAPLPVGLSYRLLVPAGHTAPAVVWEGETTLTAEEALRVAAPSSRSDRMGLAVEWLRTTLAEGPQMARDLFRVAEETGITEISLRRAQKALGVRSVRVGFGPGGGWRWSLPAAVDLPREEVL